MAPPAEVVKVYVTPVQVPVLTVKDVNDLVIAVPLIWQEVAAIVEAVIVYPLHCVFTAIEKVVDAVYVSPVNRAFNKNE